jgi:hypothetical protein
MRHSGANRAVKNVYSEIEAWTGVPFSLEACKTTNNPNTVSAGKGVETAEDWTNTRRKGSAAQGTDGTYLDNDENYLRYILGVESINLIGVLSFARVFDFTRYRSIFEIGCGDMAQAYVIHQLDPKIRYVATDLDPYVIERCKKLSVLSGIDMRVLDVLTVPDTEIPFAGFDLLMSWGMEYALDDAQLLRLFRMVREAGVPYLQCSATTIGLIQYARHWMDTRRRQALIDQGKLRVSGWLRSIGKFRSLAKQAGLEIRLYGRFGYHFCVLLTRP